MRHLLIWFLGIPFHLRGERKHAWNTRLLRKVGLLP